MDPNAPAFPTIWKRENGEPEVEYGIDRRTYIATKIMAAMYHPGHDQKAEKLWAQVAVEGADALIAELNK